MTDTQQNLLSTKKSALLTKLQLHLEEARSYLGAVGNPDHPERRKVVNAEPENAELGLPSSYLNSTLKECGLLSLSELEIRLRRATCDDTLQGLRNLLGVKAITLKYKKKNLRGEIATTRAENKLKEHNKKISFVQWQYNNSLDALIRLGLPAAELARYERVTQDDLKYLQVYLEEESGTLGEGTREIPWLWRSSIGCDSDNWQVDGEYFLLLFVKPTRRFLRT
jgi:hypothetical protein